MDFLKRQAIRTGVNIIAPMITDVLPDFIKWLAQIKKKINFVHNEADAIFTIFECEGKLIVSIVVITNDNRITRQLVNFDLSVLITNLDKILAWFLSLQKEKKTPSLEQALEFYNTLKDESKC